MIKPKISGTYGLQYIFQVVHVPKRMTTKELSFNNFYTLGISMVSHAVLM